MNKKTLAGKVYEVSHLTGTFKLRSGLISSEYFDKYLFESNPAILDEICTRMIKLIPDGTEILAGLEMGGIPIATILSAKTGLPVVFVRKKAKEYGTCKLAEGTDVAGKNLCIIEDVITTGGQVVLSTKDLRGFGAEVEHVLCVIERDEKSRDILGKEGLILHSLFTMAELKKSAGI
jgi:orotate phosphoribosyltransferase